MRYLKMAFGLIWGLIIVVGPYVLGLALIIAGLAYATGNFPKMQNIAPKVSVVCGKDDSSAITDPVSIVTITSENLPQPTWVGLFGIDVHWAALFPANQKYQFSVTNERPGLYLVIGKVSHGEDYFPFFNQSVFYQTVLIPSCK